MITLELNFLSLSDVEGIKKTLEIYFEGNKELDAQKILSVWDENLKIISIERTQGIDAWIEMENHYRQQIGNDMSKWEIEFDIISIDIYKTCASVRLDVKYRVGERTFGETQFLHLLKREKDWIIYSKIFVFYSLVW